MIGCIGTSATVSLNYKPYSAIADLHPFQFNAAHALGFSFSTSLILATDLNTGTITSNHYEVFLSLLKSPWTADSPELDPILSRLDTPRELNYQFSSVSSLSLVSTMFSSILICTQLISATHRVAFTTLAI
jgi:hypothetical protein